MHEQPEIVAIDVQLAADLVLVAVLQEQPREDVPVLGRQLRDHATDPLALFVTRQCGFHARTLIGNFHGVVERDHFALRPVDLEQDVVAHRVDECSQAFRRLQPPLFLEGAHDSKEKGGLEDRKSTRLNSSHLGISYAVFCLKKKRKKNTRTSKKQNNKVKHTHKHEKNEKKSKTNDYTMECKTSSHINAHSIATKTRTQHDQ